MARYFHLRFLLAVGVCLSLPGFAFAGASITELMYDLPGTDTGREWIEVQNTGSEDISFLKWKLFEANTNHGLTLFQGNATTSAGGFVIIADDATKFLADNPSYSGTLFSSNFSLSNTGETLELKRDGANVHQATYASSSGGAGDGNSLHFVSNGWQASSPTPGSESASEVLPGASVSSSTPSAGNPGVSESPASSPSTNSGGATWTYTPQIFVNALSPKTGVAGAPITFDAVAVGVKKEPLPNARYLWSFGDGGTVEGKKVQHIYHYPAVYTVLVDASSGEWSATDRKEITITAPELVVSNIQEGASGFIEIRNDGRIEVDLSFWQLASGAGTFMIPQGTVIGAKKTIPFPAVITNLSADAQHTKLLYPNGNMVVAFAKQQDVKVEAVEAEEHKSIVPVTTKEDEQPVVSTVSVPPPLPKRGALPQEPAMAVPISTLPAEMELIGAVGASGESSMLPWLGGVVLLSFISVGAYLAMLRPKTNSKADELRKEAATFDIIE